MTLIKKKEKYFVSVGEFVKLLEGGGGGGGGEGGEGEGKRIRPNMAHKSQKLWTNPKFNDTEKRC